MTDSVENNETPETTPEIQQEIEDYVARPSSVGTSKLSVEAFRAKERAEEAANQKELAKLSAHSDTPVEEPVETTEEPTENEETVDNENPEEKPKKKSVEEVLKGRLGYVTKQKHEAERIAAEQAQQLEVYRQLLEANKNGVPQEQQNNQQQRTYTQAELQSEAARIVQVQSFNNLSNQIFDQGKEKFNDWDESINTLRETGLMSQPLLEIAFTTDAPDAVLHYLGNDLDEAARIVQMSPVKAASELTKLAVKLSAPAKSPAISKAPPPINKTVTGTVTPTTDLAKIAANGDAREWAEARRKSGAPYMESGFRKGRR